ncbi:uncharacterized protein TNCV_3734151 [Trichonephila clavipes]|nr:uncharacterized protein TNCV_3734151 [Trichonephila clavipes]
MTYRCLNGIRKYVKSNAIKRKQTFYCIKVNASETWFISGTDENMISIYERKILRFILGGIQRNGTWRRRSNFELSQSYKESDIVNFVKIQRIKWPGPVVRMNEDHTTKKSSISTHWHTKKGQAKP